MFYGLSWIPTITSFQLAQQFKINGGALHEYRRGQGSTPVQVFLRTCSILRARIIATLFFIPQFSVICMTFIKLIFFGHYFNYCYHVLFVFLFFLNQLLELLSPLQMMKKTKQRLVDSNWMPFLLFLLLLWGSSHTLYVKIAFTNK